MNKTTQLHIVPDYTIGERCKCGAPATHKVEEVIESPERHPFTQYLCCLHFSELFGYVAQESCGLTPAPADGDVVRQFPAQPLKIIQPKRSKWSGR